MYFIYYALELYFCRVVEVTGDVDLRNSFRLIAQASIIISTVLLLCFLPPYNVFAQPEKWDSITRSWRDHLFLFGAVDLLLVDEIHHLGEERGSTLETVIVRMRRVSELYVNRTSNRSTIGSDR
jgi:replicative superfamily II helicase